VSSETPAPAPPSAPRRSSPALGFALAALILLGIALAARLASTRDPLRRAWAAAQGARTYAVKGSTRATTENGSAAHAVAGTGSAAGALVLAVSPAARQAATVTYRIAWPAVEVLDEPSALDPHALALVLPAGDPLALLAAGHGAALGSVEAVGDRLCRRVDFRVGAEAYANWWQAHQEHLPAGAEGGALHKLTGDGTLWAEPESGLPCRISARLDLPRLGGEQPGVGEVDWSYRDWGRSEDGR